MKHKGKGTEDNKYKSSVAYSPIKSPVLPLIPWDSGYMTRLPAFLVVYLGTRVKNKWIVAAP